MPFDKGLLLVELVEVHAQASLSQFISQSFCLRSFKLKEERVFSDNKKQLNKPTKYK